jgi:hypothetical protein
MLQADRKLTMLEAARAGWYTIFVCYMLVGCFLATQGGKRASERKDQSHNMYRLCRMDCARPAVIVTHS